MIGTAIALIVMFAAAVPIAFALGMAPLIALDAQRIPLIVIAQAALESLDSFTLLAIPFYVMAGRIMLAGGMATRLVGLAAALVGWVRGGLGAAGVLTAMFFATISGSSSATAAAIGSILVPEMTKRNYPKPYAAAIIASSGEIGVIIPPSIPMVIYAVTVSESIGSLFLAGILPGLLIGFSMMALIIVQSTMRGYGDPTRFVPREIARDVWAATKRATLSLLMPIIVLGGIYGGIFTATEAAVVAAVYALILGLFVYKELKWRDLPEILAGSAKTSAIVLIIVAFASVFAYVLTTYQAPQAVAAWLTAITASPLIFLLLVNGFLFIVGMFMETLAAIIILAPVLAPAAIAFGIDPIHFGTIVVVNLAVGMVTPPVGVNLFVACSISKLRMEQLMPPLLPFLATLVICLLIITYVPALSLALVR
ncbi:TRAP transporter large permease [Sediminicoccus sp. BL-A-41-H5]|uniref:TRAP transporter large permease n=1 Tax=Sediminicoccus sp. BL-A-41-H5 TaxID=3421106 RepID=UPI003D670546